MDKQPVRYKDNPVLLDKIIDDLRKKLMERLPWLNYAFGRAYKQMRYVGEGKYVEPSFYIGNGEYISLLPNDNWGNFCWFDIYDPQSINTVQRSNPRLSFKGAIIFWYNQSLIFGDDEFLYNEEIKQQVVSALSEAGLLTNRGHIQIFDVYERLENIYRGYSLEKVYNTYLYSGEDLEYIDKQYFMHPYGGLRVEVQLDMDSKEEC